MSKLKQKLIIWVPFLIIVVGSIFYSRTKGSLVINGKTMGTTYSVKIVYQGSKPDAEMIKSNIDKLLVDFNDSMSTYIPTSTISKFNQSKSTDWQDIEKIFHGL